MDGGTKNHIARRTLWKTAPMHGVRKGRHGHSIIIVLFLLLLFLYRCINGGPSSALTPSQPAQCSVRVAIAIGNWASTECRPASVD